MRNPKIVDDQPVAIRLEAGKSYAWCSCGESTNQPFCDGSHKITPYTPTVFTAETSKTVYLCMCKQTQNPGLCDGSHNRI